MKLPVIPPEVPTHDNTMMSDWARCPFLYNVRHVLGLRRPGTSAALQYGSALHAGLAVWYEEWDPVKAAEAIINYTPWEVIPDDFRTKERAVAKFADYVQHYGEEESWFGGRAGTILTETAFDIEDDDGFRWGGRIDYLPLYHGKPWVLDHKTTARFSSGYFDQFYHSPQMSGYVWAGGKLHGQTVAGVIINCIVTHKVPKTAEQQLHRRPILYDEWKLSEWKEAMIQNYHAIAEARASNNFPRNRYNCINKYGHCPLFDICKIPERNREDMMERELIHDPWKWDDEQ